MFKEKKIDKTAMNAMDVWDVLWLSNCDGTPKGSAIFRSFKNGFLQNINLGRVKSIKHVDTDNNCVYATFGVFSRRLWKLSFNKEDAMREFIARSF